MMEMGAVFLAKTPDGYRCLLTEPSSLNFLLKSGCSLRLNPEDDPKACAFDVFEQGIEKGVIVKGSVFPVGLQQEQAMIEYCIQFCHEQALSILDSVQLVRSAYQSIEKLVDSSMRYRHATNIDAFLWRDDDHPDGHTIADLVMFWTTAIDEQDFSYTEYQRHVQNSLMACVE